MSLITLYVALLATAITAAERNADPYPSFLGTTATKGAATFTFRGQNVFLSGANLAWINYGNDFGNNQTNGQKCMLRSYVRNVSKAGGNSLRVWLFVEGTAIPAFDESGNVVGTDASDTMRAELVDLARYAASVNVFLVLCLWNGAVLKNSDSGYLGLLTDDAKLTTFFDKALSPLVTALKDEPGIGAWEVINEPEGSIAIASVPSQPCFDTEAVLDGSGAGWSGAEIPIQTFQSFVNKHAACIHAADPKALVTVGSWSQYSATNAVLPGGKKFFNYWKDTCLEAAGGISAANGGALDFTQIHTYASNGKWAPSSPMALPNASSFALPKPIVIGEFSAKKCKASGCTVQQLYAHTLNGGYAGAWDWVLSGDDGNDDAATCAAGMKSVATSSKVKVAIGGTPPRDTCSCSDTAPDSSYTCAQQAGWGKCNQSFMKGYCCLSCHDCRGCQ